VLCGDRSTVALPQKIGCQYALHIDLLRLGRYRSWGDLSWPP
jgi:hypothetical protein